MGVFYIIFNDPTKVKTFPHFIQNIKESLAVSMEATILSDNTSSLALMVIQL